MAAEGQHRARLVVQGDAKSANRELAALAKSQTKLERKVESANRALDDQGRAFDKAARQARSNAKAMQEASKGAGGLGASLRAVGVGAAALGVAGAGAVAAAQKISELADEGQRVQNVFQNLAFSIAPARRATQGLATDMELALAANQAASLGVAKSAKDFAALAAAAQKLGARQGLGMQASIDSLIIGIGRQSTRVLDNLGIILKVQDAHEQYAAALGKTTSELTEAEKAESFRVIGLQKVFEAAENVTINTDGAAAAVKRFKVELDNLKTEALGGEDRVLRLADGLRTLQQQGELTTGGFQSVRAQASKVRNELFEMGVASKDVAISSEELFEAIQKVRTEEEDQLVQLILNKEITADNEAALERMLQTMEDSPVRMRHFQEALEQIRFEGFKADFDQWEKGIRNLAGQVEGMFVGSTGESARRRRGGSRRQQGDVVEAVLAEEVAATKRAAAEIEDIETASLGRRLEAIDRQAQAELALLQHRLNLEKDEAGQIRLNGQIAALEHDARLAREDAIVDSLEREVELQREIRAEQQATKAANLQATLGAAGRSRELAQVRSDEAVQRAETGGVIDLQARVQARLNVAAAIDEEHRAERELLEFRLANSQTEAERIALESEMRDLEHREKLNQIEQEKLARHDLMAAREQQLAKERQLTQFGISLAQQQAQQVGQALIGLSFSQQAAARTAKESGESEAKARRRATGQALLSISQQLAGQALSHGFQAAAAFATFNPVMGAAHLAAAAVLGGGAAILSSRGNAILGEVGGAGGSVSLGGGAGAGGGAAAAAGSGGGDPSDIPTSASAGTGGPGPANEPPPPQQQSAGNVYHINLQSLAPTRETARAIRDEIDNLADAEAG